MIPTQTNAFPFPHELIHNSSYKKINTENESNNELSSFLSKLLITYRQFSIQTKNLLCLKIDSNKLMIRYLKPRMTQLKKLKNFFKISNHHDTKNTSNRVYSLKNMRHINPDHLIAKLLIQTYLFLNTI